jgi:hypothetical protein
MGTLSEVAILNKCVVSPQIAMIDSLNLNSVVLSQSTET